MIQRHKDGSFYTQGPTDTWQALNKHLMLGKSTRSPVLHVMIADKIVIALNTLIEDIIQYVQNTETTEDEELKEIELEFFCALANDNATHIEEVMAVIESFEIEELRQRMDETFSSVIIGLVSCGEACLKRLAGTILSDVKEVIGMVFTEEWIDGGNQVQVAFATITDYFQDLASFLMPFWSQKFMAIIFESLIVQYASVVLTRSNSEDGVNSESSLGPSTSPACGLNAESLGRLAQDVNAFHAFFCAREEPEAVSELLNIINEISLMCVTEPMKVAVHSVLRITECPSSATVRPFFYYFFCVCFCAWAESLSDDANQLNHEHNQLLIFIAIFFNSSSSTDFALLPSSNDFVLIIAISKTIKCHEH